MMIDVASLPLDEMARQLGRPESEVGIAVAEYMNRVNRDLSEAAYRRLALANGSHVLEIGFGNGRLIPLLIGMARDVHYVGAEISATMVDEAAAANREMAEDNTSSPSR